MTIIMPMRISMRISSITSWLLTLFILNSSHTVNSLRSTIVGHHHFRHASFHDSSKRNPTQQQQHHHHHYERCDGRHCKTNRLSTTELLSSTSARSSSTRTSTSTTSTSATGVNDGMEHVHHKMDLATVHNQNMIYRNKIKNHGRNKNEKENIQGSKIIDENTDTKNNNNNANIPLYQLAMAGALATCIGDASIHPMDCIKTLQQSDEGMTLSFSHAVSYIWQQYGVSGFYRGLGTYLFTDACAGALKFTCYDILQQQVRRLNSSSSTTTTTATTTTTNDSMEAISIHLHDKTKNQDSQTLMSSSSDDAPSPTFQLFLQNAACAGMAFLASSIVLVPGEFLKQQLQMGHYATITEAMIDIYTNHGGLPGFMTGYAGVCLRDIPYTMMELGLYDFFTSTTSSIFHPSKKQRQEENQSSSSSSSSSSSRVIATTTVESSSSLDEPQIMSSSSLTLQDEILAAALVGAIAGFLTTPLDTIKTKIMVDSYANFNDCFMAIMMKTTTTAATTSSSAQYMNHDLVSGTFSFSDMSIMMSTLFSGATARVAWLVPFSAIYLPLFTAMKRQLQEWANETDPQNDDDDDVIVSR